MATELLGRDLAARYRVTDGRHEDVDVGTRGREVHGEHLEDADLVAGIDNAVQAVIHRIKTLKGELAALGHPEYGSRHHELIGQPNVERTRALIKLHVLDAMRHEPRVVKVLACDVTPAHRPPRDVVRITMTMQMVDEIEPRNLVVPFSLELSADGTTDAAGVTP